MIVFVWDTLLSIPHSFPLVCLYGHAKRSSGDRVLLGLSVTMLSFQKAPFGTILVMDFIIKLWVSLSLYLDGRHYFPFYTGKERLLPKILVILFPPQKSTFIVM